MAMRFSILLFFIGWFLPGVVFYNLYMGFRFKQHFFIGLCSLIMVFCLLRDVKVFFAATFSTMLMGCFVIFSLFLLMIYRKKYLGFLEYPLLTRIGVISYTIYLIHESIGVLLINKYGKYLGAWSALSPFIIIIMATGFAELSYRFYEKKAGLFLKRIFSKRSDVTANQQ